MWRIVVGLFLLFSCAGVAESASSLPAPLAKALAKLTAVQGFTCRFEQSVVFSDGSSQQYSGTLAVLKPGRFRWHYSKPYEQLYVGNGKRIWHYEPDLLQVRVLKNLDTVDPLVMRLLQGQVNADEITVLDKSKTGVKEGGGLRYHTRFLNGPEVWLGVKNGRLQYVESLDALGNRNHMRWIGISYSAPASGQFEFKVPEGVDVVDAQL